MAAGVTIIIHKVTKMIDKLQIFIRNKAGNTKLNRILDEIKRAEEKIAAWQGHLEELNIRKKQLEDAEIIKSIRSMKLDSREMLAFLENIQNGTVAVREEQSGQAAGQDGDMQEETENIGKPEKAPAGREDRGNEEKD